MAAIRRARWIVMNVLYLIRILGADKLNQDIQQVFYLTSLPVFSSQSVLH